jgi:hypothetical protein
LNFIEGTDIDLEQELLEVSKEINPNFEISGELSQLISFPLAMAKRHSFEYGTPRFFEYRILDELSEPLIAEGSLDGYINLLFRSEKVSTIKSISKDSGANIYVLYKNSKDIAAEIFTIKKYDLLIVKFDADKSALKLLENEREYHIRQLTELVVDNLFNSQTNEWFFNGEQVIILTRTSLNTLLSEVCNKIYHKTPRLKNELINKEFLSTPINIARRNLFRQILSSETEENLGYNNDKFPPDKAIYLSLLQTTQIHKRNHKLGYFELSPPPKESVLFDLWQTSKKFLKTAASKRNLSELYSELAKAPFKLKRGFVDFWVPIFLLANKEDYALFHVEGGFIPFLDEDNLAFIHKNPANFLIKSYSIGGVKVNLLEGYKELVQVNGDTDGNKSTFLTVFGNFLRFQRGLKPYSLNTKNLSESSIKLRDAISKAKDPEEALFVTFPAALGFHSISHKSDNAILENYIFQLKYSIKEIRTSYEELFTRIEKSIRASFFCNPESSFHDYKEEILSKISGIDSSILNTKYTIFYKRIVSPLDDKESWIKSVADVAIGKGVDTLSDDEEPILHKSIMDLAKGLLKASELQDFNKISKNEKMISYQLFRSSGESITDKVILSKETIEQQKDIQARLLKDLSNFTSEQRRGLLLNLLEEELSNQ